MGSRKVNQNKKKTKGGDNSKNDPSPTRDGAASVISDPRFSSMHTDPRFRDAPKRKTQVAIDHRFDRLYTHKSFMPSSAPVDKRGRPRPNKGPTPLHASLRHYKREEEEKDKEEDDSVDESEEEDGVEKSSEDELKGKRVPAVDEQISESESSESQEGSESVSDTDTDTDTETDEGSDVEGYDAEAPEKKEDVPEIEKETHRLAVVNMDWRYVQAADLYVLLSSFVPPNGLIKSVTVYPSEFGIQRMEEEEVRGPVGLFDDKKEKNDEDGSDDDNDIDDEKLREYEKSRMRYYFAVVECDSITTADCIYKECDGLEFMQSSNALDLRFIPDDMEFKHPPRDVATEVPANYDCKDFYSRALQHSKVNLSWDEDEPLRTKTLQRKFTKEQLAQLELKEFWDSDESENELKELVASDESESGDDGSESGDDEDNNVTEVQLDEKGKKQENASECDDAEDNNESEDQLDKKAKKETGDQLDKEAKRRELKAKRREAKMKKREEYRALLLSGDGSEGDSKNDNVKDMEVTFNTGLEDISKHIMEKKDKKSETVWEAFLRKKREKKRARKNKSKDSSDGYSSDAADQEAAEEADDFFEEPASKKRKKAQSRNDDENKGMDEAGEATKEELELLLADDQGADVGPKGYNLKFKKGNGKKKDDAIDESKIPSSASDDPRFAAFFSPDFAIDPTHPQFKRSATYARQLAQKKQKVHLELPIEREYTNPPPDDSGMMKKGDEGPVNLKSRKDKHELSSLVQSIKTKLKQTPLPSDAKRSRDGKSRKRH